MDIMMQFWAQLTARPDFWGFICIPIVAAVVTWAHVWCAIQMVFYPLEFVGIRTKIFSMFGFKFPGIGWQGIIPRKARKMSNIVVDKTISKMGTVSDFLREMEPEKIGDYVSRAVSVRIEEYVDDVMNEHNRVLWENLPKMIKNRVYEHVRKRLPDIMDHLVKAIIDNIDDLVDVKEMCGNQMEADRSLIVRIFQEVGDKEFKFIINVSFWIGLGFGFIQMILFYFVPWHALLPLYAAVLGLATNWLALAMVFRPLQPTKVGPFTFQGVFLKRQPAVSDKFAELTSREMLTVGHFMREILAGKNADRTRLLVKRHVAPMLESPIVRTAMQMTMGPGGYADIKSSIAARSTHMAMDPLSDVAFNMDRAKVLARMFSEKMKALSTVEFQDLLRPAFQEDEWILLVLGAVTGLIAGTLQLMIGFS
jgi:uncharacterized membrane protein YheB (UPF0754 family)